MQSNFYKKHVKYIGTLILTIALALVAYSIPIAFGQSVDELQEKIDDRNSNIKKLEAEIKKFQEEITIIGKEANTLKSAIAELDITKKKLDTEVKLTEKKIESVNDEIRRLTRDIGAKETHIKDSRMVIANSMTVINEIDSASVLEAFLSKNSLGEAWTTIDELSYVQDNLKENITELKAIKVNLESNKKQTEKKKAELVTLTKELRNQVAIVASTAKEKTTLLNETKNLESNYKALVADRQAKKEAFEREVLEYESALKIAIDPTQLPTSGKGVLRWPVDNVYITQYFGNTAFATANAQIYNGRGHTGIDLRASIGTPIKASMSGVVIGTGNTDIVRGCYSYGKWVMIKHPNGLSTLYAHLSLINVVKGESVSTGSIIGYSGSTGYVTGPHLHYGVYATEGVRITTLTNSKNCTGVTIPIADFKAYLNPLSFL
jgi:murein DD-endopeptidase MepM/ murein hydrolase activator NlpD